MNKKISFKIILLLSISITIFAKEYHVKKSDKNIVKFISNAPIEDFEGVTDNIDGYLFYEKNLANSYFNDMPYGFGVGINFATKFGTFSLVYALGSQQKQPILFRNSKVHFGYIAYF